MTGTKRSRSAPARSSESPSSNGGSQGSRVWAEPRHKGKDEPLELKKYDVDDVERLQRRRQEDAEVRGVVVLDYRMYTQLSVIMRKAGLCTHKQTLMV